MQEGINANTASLSKILSQPFADLGAIGRSASHQRPIRAKLLLCLHSRSFMSQPKLALPCGDLSLLQGLRSFLGHAVEH